MQNIIIINWSDLTKETRKNFKKSAAEIPYIHLKEGKHTLKITSKNEQQKTH